MERDTIWQAFAETGDPMYYLLYKSTQDPKAKPRNNSKTDGNGDMPRSED